MVSIAFENVITEHFDVTDDYTRKTLLSIDEADQSKVLDSLTSKLYQSIMDKVYDIDFNGVEETKGDITKLQNYETMLECITIIKDILIAYRNDTKIPDEILNAISNIRERKDIFEKAFNLNINLPIVLYNTITLSIVSSVSLIISTSIEFIKDAGDASYDIKFDKVSYVKTSQSLLYTNLIKFNNSCRTGELDKSLDYVIKGSTKQLLGIDSLTVVSVIGVTGLVLCIIPILRELVFFFYHSKQSISDYFEIQADLIQMNTEYLKQNNAIGMTEKEKKEVIKRQDKFVSVFRKIGNAMCIDYKKSEQKAKKDTDNNKKKYKVDDVVKTKLDSAPDILPSTTPQSSLF